MKHACKFQMKSNECCVSVLFGEYIYNNTLGSVHNLFMLISCSLCILRFSYMLSSNITCLLSLEHNVVRLYSKSPQGSTLEMKASDV